MSQICWSLSSRRERQHKSGPASLLAGRERTAATTETSQDTSKRQTMTDSDANATCSGRSPALKFHTLHKMKTLDRWSHAQTRRRARPERCDALFPRHTAAFVCAL